LITTFNELSSESGEIIAALDSLRDQSNAVKTVYAQMLTMTDQLRTAMKELMELSSK